MPLRLDVKKKLHTKTERVKCVDFHSSEPWVLSALYSGHLLIHNWEEQVTVKTIEVNPNTVIRCAKFIPRKQWVVCGSDDMIIRVFNYHSLEKVKEFDAHADFIRHIAVHPTLPLILSASDDMTVRLWNWSQNWDRIASFEGHMHYVMMAQWNPKDHHIFATASLDRSIKVWGAQTKGSDGIVSRPHFNLLGHESGVNCIEYSSSGEKPYIVSGGDDKTVRVWDYQTKQCVQVLTEHSKPVICVTFHPFLPIILSGSEDATVNVWHATTYRLEMSLKYNMGRIWSLTSNENGNTVAIGTDEGTIVLKLGNDRPAASLQGGKIIMAKASEIQAVNVKLIDASLYADGERLPLSLKDMGACEMYPQSISHHPNGRLLAVCGDGEYVVYTSQALRNKAYGKALDFVWSSEGSYAVRDETGKITVYSNFKEHLSLKPTFPVEEMFGGKLICLRSLDFICFYDWKDLKLKRRINVYPQGIYWNDVGTHVVIAGNESLFVLRYDPNAISTEDDEDGAEDAFDMEIEIMEKAESGCWVGDCFAFTTARLRLQTLTSGLIETVAFLDRQAWLLGYVSDLNRLYIIDREHFVMSFKLHMSFIEYQTAICRRDFDGANALLDKVPQELRNKVARFLESQGQKETALAVTTDLDHKFELARSLEKLELCAQIIQEASKSSSGALYDNQWKQLGDLALERGAIPLSVACFKEAQDLNGLLLIYSSTGNIEGLEVVAEQALKKGKTNVAMLAYILLQDVDKCISTLLAAGRVPEAAIFAKTYVPSRVKEVVEIWRKKLADSGYSSAAKSLADPVNNPALFPDFDVSLLKENQLRVKAVDDRSGYLVIEPPTRTCLLTEEVPEIPTPDFLSTDEARERVPAYPTATSKEQMTDLFSPSSDETEANVVNAQSVDTISRDVGAEIRGQDGTSDK